MNTTLKSTSTTTSPKSSLAKLGLHVKPKTLKVMVIGQNGVGKTALIVRFITGRFIGDYDAELEKIYTCNSWLENDFVQFEILDAIAPPDKTECSSFDSNIRWADAFILLYSVTDKCSFDECNRMKFLINYNKRRRKLGSNSKDYISDIPVILVGNKIDVYGERMISKELGYRLFRELDCTCFYEISVREYADQVQAVFRDLLCFWRVLNKFPKLKRSSSDVQNIHHLVLSPDAGCTFYGSTTFTRRSLNVANGSGTRLEENAHLNKSNNDMGSGSICNSKSEIETPFRSRASTEGNLPMRPRRWRYPPPTKTGQPVHTNRVERRMSISMRGSNASY